jgi:hypothetical protein
MWTRIPSIATSRLAPVALRAGAAARRLVLAVTFVGLGLALGCANVNVRGDNSPDNALGDLCRQRRTPDQDCQSAGVSNKAQQVERDLGVE